MASENHYPDDLNPFGTDEEDESTNDKIDSTKSTKGLRDEYPNYLSPFEEDDNQHGPGLDDYDDSLNPFGDDEAKTSDSRAQAIAGTDSSSVIGRHRGVVDDNYDGKNPFEESDPAIQNDISKSRELDTNNLVSQSINQQPASLEPPPVPLPRTKSLLKKGQAQRGIQQKDQGQGSSLHFTTSSTSSSSLTTASGVNIPNTSVSLQKKTNKRNAPPVPIYFKRQVSGSLDDIEIELNEIGDRLAIIDEESNSCLEALKATDHSNEVELSEKRERFIQLVKQKNTIVRRQKELMYKKRELKLDRIHSDIEYELRMIGNKQLSHRTPEDDLREKELLKKLVEIVEEKSDIVENLNRDTTSDCHDVEEAFKRLNLTSDPLKTPTEIDQLEDSSITSVKNENCDKSKLAMGAKLSKIATLLPKSGTIKGTMKIKRKRLFKRCESRPIER